MSKEMDKEGTTIIDPGSQGVASGASFSSGCDPHLLAVVRKLINGEQPADIVELYELINQYHSQLEKQMWTRLRLSITGPQDFEPFLSLVKKAHKQGYFGKELKYGTKTLGAFLAKEKTGSYLPEGVYSPSGLKLRWKKSSLNKQSYWKARHLIYELSDYFNLSNENFVGRVQRDGRRAYSLLHLLEQHWEDVVLSDDERQVVREMVLFSSCRGNELRRQHQYGEALAVFDSLINFTERLVSDTVRCDGTLATLLYHKAVVLRGQERLGEAAQTFSQTIEQYHKRAETRSATRDVNDALFTARRVAMCLGLGFAWISLTKGQLRRSENAMRTARSLLATSNDELISAYLDLLLGSIVRCRAGTKRKQELRESIKHIEKSKKTFAALKHDRYLARANRELALAYEALQQYPESLRLLTKVEQFAKSSNDHKWLANVAIQRSRICRGEARLLLEPNSKMEDHDGRRTAYSAARTKLQQALEWAETAVATANKGGQALPMVDALLAHGQARFELAELAQSGGANGEAPQGVPPEQGFAEARRDFEDALERLKPGSLKASARFSPNPKVEAVCVLCIARCFVRENNQPKADQQLERWAVLEEDVQHGWVRELASKTQNEIDQMYGDFSLSVGDRESLKYNEQLVKLREWIYKQAHRKTKGNKQEIAKLLGVSRATLYEWKLSNSGTRIK